MVKCSPPSARRRISPELLRSSFCGIVGMLDDVALVLPSLKALPRAPRRAREWHGPAGTRTQIGRIMSGGRQPALGSTTGLPRPSVALSCTRIARFGRRLGRRSTRASALQLGASDGKFLVGETVEVSGRHG